MGYQALLFCPDEKTARSVTLVLNDLDFTVESCSEPFAAVKRLMAQHFDAVVVDCDNEQNAALLFKSARNSTSNQSALAVAVVEGQAGVAKAFRIGANLVLTKPINVEQAKGTLRVARGLLRKGGEASKSTAPTPSAPAPKPAAPASRPAPPVAPAPSFSAANAPRTSAIPAPPPQRSAPPAMAASSHTSAVDDLDSDAILEDDSPEIESSQPAQKPEPPAPPTGMGTQKFPWQPSPKMAEPMASALRRAAEAAGQIEAEEVAPARPLTPAPAPAPEKRVMTGAMFQAQGHAAAPAPAIEKPSPVIEKPASVAAAPAIEETPVISRPAIHESPERTIPRPMVDTTQNDTPPPTFFPGAYDPEETEGGGKTKAIVIIAAVVLLACSAGYLSWKNSSGKSAAAAPSASSAPVSAAAAAPPASEPAAHEATTPAQPATEDITLAAPRTAPAKPSPKQVAPEPEPEPEVTQRLIVRNDVRHTAKTPEPQEQETVQAPSAIGLATSSDTKALASISSAPTNVPKPSPQMLRVSQGVMEGLVLKRVQPRYPPQALQMRIQGSVQLQATISKTGDIENLKVVSGDSLLARAAQDAVKQWKYKPYYLNGDPVQIETQILVNFKLPN